ncbi:hypothetical protein EIP91_005481 [Steccherinum ochraceum]|uniref:F-box domain-containing protein n=1 Tax=Steccherinum ochraceum TaxID=92696 RepID=A0A4R0RXI9_9APHY|nr:hypothetical protein EIP91_005481 [Steccherinum ochraceum]
MPVLQELSLSHFKLEWTHSIFRLPLVKLSVRGVIEAQVLSTLGNMQQLKYLDIGGAIVLDELPITTLPSQPPRSVRLPHLEHLTVSGSTLQCMLLWMHLDIPLSATVTLEFKFDSTAKRDLDLRGPRDTTNFRFYTNVPSMETAQPPTMQPHFTLTISAASLDPRVYLDHFLYQLPLPHVQALYVGELDGWSSLKSHFNRFMTTLPNITSCHVTSAVKDYVEVLLTKRVEDQTAEKSQKKGRRTLQWAAPYLRTLVFHDVMHPCQDSFIKAVKAREKAGCGLDRVVLLNCTGVRESKVEILRKSLDGAEVVWDGIEREYEILSSESEDSYSIEPASEESDFFGEDGW